MAQVGQNQARRQDSETGRHKQILGGTKTSILRIRECGPKNIGLHSEFSQILGVKTKKKRSSFQNMRKFPRILRQKGKSSSQKLRELPPSLGRRPK